MKKILCIAVLLASPICSIASETPLAPSPYVVSQPGFEISARRGTAEGTFEISAVLSDAETGKAIASPKLTVRAGTWATASIGQADGEAQSASFSASVDPSGSVAAFLAHSQKPGTHRKTYSGTVMVTP